MTNAEAITSAFGDELTELSGFWTTRLTAVVLAEQQVQSQTLTATGSFAVTALLGTWEWRGSVNTPAGSVPRTILSTDAAQVQVDDYIRLDSDGQFFRITAIAPGTGPVGEDEVSIANPSELTVPTGTGASSVSDPAVVTIPGSPDFLLTVAAGMRFRILTGALTALDGVVASRDSGTQITLVTGFPAAFASQSFEIVVDPAASLPVESTLNFPDEGRVVLDGIVYFYAGKTVSSFDGLTYDDGTGTVTPGVQQRHEPASPVADFSEVLSVLDQYRNSFTVERATWSDLGIVGANIGVPRPDALGDDDVYRRLIQAVAYAPRGTVYAIEQALDVLIGPGLYEIFEDLTSGSPLENTCTVFLARTGTVSERFVGKAFLDGHDSELLPLDNATEITLPDDDFVTFAGLHPAAEGGAREIDGSTSSLVASADSGVTVTGPAATFSTRIEPGDFLQLLTGPLQGALGVVLSRDSDQQLTLGVVQGESNPSPTATGALGANFSGASWRVFRDKSNVRQYRPSAETILEGGNVVAPWEYVGAAVETTRVTPNYTGGAIYNALLFNTNGAIVAYRKRLRIRPEDTVVIEAVLDTDSTQTSGDPPSQHGLVFGDGNRMVAFGTQLDPVNAHVNAGFFDLSTGNFLKSGGDFIWSGVVNTIFVPGFNTVIIEKRGTRDVRLWRKNDAGGAGSNPNNAPLELVAQVPYTSFLDAATALPLLAYTSPTAKDLTFGTLIAGVAIPTLWRAVDFRVVPHSEFDNQLYTIARGDSASPNQLTTLDSFATGVFPPGGTDVGREVRVRDSQAANASGGNALGSWEAVAQPNATTLTVVGTTYRRGSFSLQNRSVLSVRNFEDAFVWPRVLGHSVEILDGPNAGTYPILDVVDEATGKAYEDPPENASTAAMTLESTDPADATAPAGSGPQVRVVGQVSGAQAAATYSLAAGAQTPVTGFDAGTVVAVELLPVVSGGRRSQATVAGDVLLRNADLGEVLRIPAGETSAGKDTLRQLKTVDGAFFDSTGVPLAGSVNTVADPPTEHRSGSVLLDTSALPGGAFTVEAAEVRWRLVPSFPSGDATFDVVGLLLETAAADTYAQRDTPAWPGGYGSDASNLELMSVYRTKVLSAQLHAAIYPNGLNDFPTQDYDLYPFYLADNLGTARTIIEQLTAAGVIPDFTSAFIDAAGFHV